MRFVVLSLVLAACAEPPTPVGEVDPATIGTDERAEETVGYEDRLGDADRFVHECDLDDGRIDLACTRVQFVRVQDDIDACAIAQGVAPETVEDQRHNSHGLQASDTTSPAMADHLERTQDLVALRREADPYLPCRVLEGEAEPLWPLFRAAWELGGCE